MKTKTSRSNPLRWAVLACALGVLSLAWHDAPAADVKPPPADAEPAAAEVKAPEGSYVGVITIKTLPVKVRLDLKGETDGSVEYGPTLDCGLALTFVVETEDGFSYAFKPKPGGSAGMAPYCNRLLGGRAWLKPSGGGFNYLPLDNRATPLDHAVVDPVRAKR